MRKRGGIGCLGGGGKIGKILFLSTNPDWTDICKIYMKILKVLEGEQGDEKLRRERGGGAKGGLLRFCINARGQDLQDPVVCYEIKMND